MEPQLPKGRGQAGGIDQRWRIEPETFQRNYNPTGPPEVTHLLYEIHWDRNSKPWRQWCTSNSDQHAEINFLENAREEINRRRTKPCFVFCFLSWSPCGRCSHSIIEFLQEHPNVTLDIRFSQLYRSFDRRNQNGLRALANHGVQISVMQLPDYHYCWRTFVSHRRNRDYWAWNFFPFIHFYSQELDWILRTWKRMKKDWILVCEVYGVLFDGDSTLVWRKLSLFLLLLPFRSSGNSVKCSTKRSQMHWAPDCLKPQRDSGQLVKDTNIGWRIKPEDFERNYTPASNSKATYLLYEIHWDKSPRTWKNWCTSDDKHHAEINFLKDDCKEIKRRKNKPCSVTWFLSWSPCHECSQSIIEFLGNHPNVTLDIRASRLYRDFDEQNRSGLRALVDHRIPVSIMHLGDGNQTFTLKLSVLYTHAETDRLFIPPDYSYCWRTFVAHQRNQCKDYKDFFKMICAWNEKLCSVLDRSGHATHGHRLELVENQ